MQVQRIQNNYVNFYGLSGNRKEICARLLQGNRDDRLRAVNILRNADSNDMQSMLNEFNLSGNQYDSVKRLWQGNLYDRSKAINILKKFR